jgi:ribosomal protein L37E
MLNDPSKRVWDDEAIAAYHRLPKGEAWKQCTVRGIIEDGKRLWITCAGCQRNEYHPAREWCAERGVDLDMPLLLLNRQIRCSQCGLRTVKICAEPYSISKRSPA